jgi:membrane-anchored glycerophosphoryl diester phosphodiesterase (GDPDase)
VAAAVNISLWFTVTVVIVSFLVDVALTFVVPALTLNVRSVRSALSLGWRVTRRTRPTNAWCIFAPGVTIVALAAVLPRSVASTGVYLGVGLLSTLIRLWFKGVIVAF